VPIACDVSRRADIEQLVAAVLERFGRIDTLVNVAGVNRRKPALDVTEEDYDFISDINLKGAFLLSQSVGRHMVQRRSGSQINIASINTDRPLVNVLPYAMSKAGMGHMTRGLAAEWGPHGVRVNAIAPGFILTDLTQKLWSDVTMRTWGESNTPLRRLGRPQDLIGAAIFLASPASAFMTGQTLFVDGGFTAGWAWPIPNSGGH
jgi:NAD(P)-dependent dehydrogenase (short-subunit alcohol dehydrogenase family)